MLVFQNLIPNEYATIAESITASLIFPEWTTKNVMTEVIVNFLARISDRRERTNASRAAARFGWQPCRPAALAIKGFESGADDLREEIENHLSGQRRLRRRRYGRIATLGNTSNRGDLAMWGNLRALAVASTCPTQNKRRLRQGNGIIEPGEEIGQGG